MGVLQDVMIPDSNGVLTTEHVDTSSPYLDNNFASVSSESWRIAEQATQRIICQVQPTLVSEERRKAVVDYVQRLIKAHMGSVVLPFGSVPLKTYLPDGDIDLTAFGSPIVEDTLTNELSSVLEREEQNNEAEFVVRDVQVINAEVKLVKCLVQNIVVDISFNQLGGLCTLCFLEKIDRLIGKDHLFKRSIILIKAWCYYESRILGAHHGLISTYALETMVLYIFHLFHSSLNGPLAVLFRFLDYFSTFDWDNYCISLNGLIRVSSLPEITAERSDNGSLPLLLSAEFLRDCIAMFSVPVRPHEIINSRMFMKKHLNIVDPLKENNNLGRSVSKGNSYRIRSAFTYGARKLGHILSQTVESIFDELPKFFMNTLDRHGNGQRPDVQDVLLVSDLNGNGSAMPSDNFLDDDIPSMPRGTEDASTSEFRRMKASNDITSCSLKNGERDTLVSGKAHHAPHLYFADRSLGNSSLDNKEAEATSSCNKNGKVDTPNERAGTLVACSQNSCNGNRECAAVASTSGEDEGSCLNHVSDLSVEHDVHIQYLCYGRWWYEQFASGASTIPPTPPLHFHSKNQWSSARRPVHFIQTPYSHNGIIHSQFFTMPPNMIPGSVFGVEDLSKPRGTGTYFPDMTHQLNRMRSASRGRNHMMLRSNSSRTLSSSESADGILDWSSNLPTTMRNSVERGSNSADYRHSCSPRRKQQQQLVAEKTVEFGSFSQLHLGLPPTPNSRHQNNNNLCSPTPGFQRKPVHSASVSNEDRRSSYHLKDDIDFPPLSPFGGSYDTKKYENGT